MKKTIVVLTVLGLAFFATGTSAAKLGNQVGAEQTKAQVTAYDEEDSLSPNSISGDGVPNRTQDEEFGHYGEGDGDMTQEREQVRDEDCDGEDCDKVQKQLREQEMKEDGAEEQYQERTQTQLSEMNEGDVKKVQARQQTATGALKGLRTATEEVQSPETARRMAAIIEELELGREEAVVAEVKLEKRSGFAKFFIGGDDDAAEEVKRIANENKGRLQEMTRIVEACADCEEPVKTELMLQTQMMEQEQLRLDELAEKEMNRKGLFGFLFGWIGD